MKHDISQVIWRSHRLDMTHSLIGATEEIDRQEREKERTESDRERARESERERVRDRETES